MKTKNKPIGIKVGEIMTRNLITVPPSRSLLDCAKLMTKKRVGSLLIQEEGVLKGIITEKDIIWALTKKSKKDLSEIKASDISPKKLITIKPGADISDAIRKMNRHKYRRLPVVIKDKVIGYLTLKDILKVEPALFDIAQGYFQIKEESQKLARAESPEKFEIGICEECGNTDLLYNVDGKIICESCKDAM